MMNKLLYKLKEGFTAFLETWVSTLQPTHVKLKPIRISIHNINLKNHHS